MSSRKHSSFFMFFLWCVYIPLLEHNNSVSFKRQQRVVDVENLFLLVSFVLGWISAVEYSTWRVLHYLIQSSLAGCILYFAGRYSWNWILDTKTKTIASWWSLLKSWSNCHSWDIGEAWVRRWCRDNTKGFSLSLSLFLLFCQKF